MKGGEAESREQRAKRNKSNQRSAVSGRARMEENFEGRAA